MRRDGNADRHDDTVQKISIKILFGKGHGEIGPVDPIRDPLNGDNEDVSC